MRVWVDCTAAAHPLVLRPIVELLTARGHEVSVTTREYGQTIGILDRLGITYEVFGGHGGAGTGAKARALASRSAALARWARPRRFDLALAHGSVDVAAVGSAVAHPLGADAGLRMGRPAAKDQLASRAPRNRSRRDTDRPPAARRGRQGQARSLSGPEGGLLPRRLRARPSGSGRARDRAELDPRRGPPAARELGLSRRQRDLLRGDRAPGGRRGNDGCGDPAHRPPGR